MYVKMKEDRETEIKKLTKFTLLLLSMVTMMPNIAIVTFLPLLSEAHKRLGILFFIDPLREDISKKEHTVP